MTCWDEKMPVFYDNLAVVLFNAIRASCSRMEEFRHLLCFSCVNYFWLKILVMQFFSSTFWYKNTTLSEDKEENVEVTKSKALANGDNEGIWGNFLKKHILDSLFWKDQLISWQIYPINHFDHQHHFKDFQANEHTLHRVQSVNLQYSCWVRGIYEC